MRHKITINYGAIGFIFFFLQFFFLVKRRKKIVIYIPHIIINGVETFFSCKSTIYSIIKYEKKRLGKKLFQKKRRKKPRRVEYCSGYIIIKTMVKAELLIIMQTRLHSQ